MVRQIKKIGSTQALKYVMKIHEVHEPQTARR